LRLAPKAGGTRRRARSAGCPFRVMPAAPLLLARSESAIWFDPGVDPTVAVALIGVAGTVASGLGGHWIAGVLADRRERRLSQRARWDNTLAVLEAASEAFLAARLALDQALLQSGDARLDSSALYRSMAISQAGIALRLGGSNPISLAYDEAVKRWAEALNLAVQGVQENKDAIVDARNAADDAQKRFLDQAAPFVGPEAPDQLRLTA